jgi:hypothetical protein
MGIVFRLPACGTKTLHLQMVSLDMITVFPGQLLFQAMEEQVLELQDFPAAQTPQMVVVRVAVDVLVMPVAVAEIHLPNQPAVNEQGQSPVDGGLGDLDPFLFELQIKAVHVEVAVNLKDLLENALPLWSAAQFPVADIILKYL